MGVGIHVDFGKVRMLPDAVRNRCRFDGAPGESESVLTARAEHERSGATQLIGHNKKQLRGEVVLSVLDLHRSCQSVVEINEIPEGRNLRLILGPRALGDLSLDSEVLLEAHGPGV